MPAAAQLNVGTYLLCLSPGVEDREAELLHVKVEAHVL